MATPSFMRDDQDTTKLPSFMKTAGESAATSFMRDDSQPIQQAPPEPSSSSFMRDDSTPQPSLRNSAERQDAGYNVLGGLRDVGKLIYDIPAQLGGAVGNLMEDRNPEERITKADSLRNSAKARTDMRAAALTPEEKAQKIIPLPGFLSEDGALTRGDILDTSASTGFSLASMGAGLITAAPGMLVGPWGAAATGMVGSGAAAYKMDRTMVTQQLLDAADEAVGYKLSAAEQNLIIDKADSVIRNHALWEAGPEAVGNALSMTGLGKVVSGAAKGVTKKIIAGFITSLGGELSTETITQIGQNIAEHELGLQGGEKLSFSDPSSYPKALKQVAPQVIPLVGLMGGASAVGGKIYNKVKYSPQRDAALTKFIQGALPDAQFVEVKDGIANVDVVTETGSYQITATAENLAKALGDGVTIQTLSDMSAEAKTHTNKVIADQIQEIATPEPIRDTPVRWFNRLPNSENSINLRLDSSKPGKPKPTVDYTYTPVEGQTVADLEAGIKDKSNPGKVAWLEKNAVTTKVINNAQNVGTVADAGQVTQEPVDAGAVPVAGVQADPAAGVGAAEGARTEPLITPEGAAVLPGTAPQGPVPTGQTVE